MLAEGQGDGTQLLPADGSLLHVPVLSQIISHRFRLPDPESDSSRGSADGKRGDYM